MKDFYVAAEDLSDPGEITRGAFQSAAIGMALVSPAGKWLAVNAALCRIVGYSEAELLATTFQAITHPEDLDADVALAHEVLAGQRRSYEMEKRYFCKSGGIVWVLLTVSLVRAADGTPQYFVSQIQDITRRRVAEDALDERTRELEAQRDFLAVLLDSLSEGIVACDAAGRLTLLNRTMREWHGVATEDEELGELTSATRPGWYGVHDADGHTPVPVNESPLARALTGREPVAERELVLRPPGGTERVIMVSGRPIRDRAGTLLGAVAAGRDVTDWKRAQAAIRERDERLREARRLAGLGRLAAGVAHEFNNLLTTIKGDAYLLGESLAPDDARRADLAEISDAVDRGAALTTQLLAFGKRHTAVPRALDIGRSLHDAVERWSGTKDAARYPTAFDHGPSTPIVAADPEHLARALDSIIANAREAMPDGGPIAISSCAIEIAGDAMPPLAPGRYARVDVTDRGEGIAADAMPHVFEPFYTTRAGAPGRGVGLPAALGIVQQAGGTIRIASERGVGTTVSILLPERSPADDLPAQRGAMQHILVVDDEQAVRRISRRVLERAGFAVSEAQDGREALEHLRGRSGDVAVVVTDLVMPEMGGAELAARIVEQWPAMPIVIVSGYAPNDPTTRDAARLAAAFLRKPFSPTELVDHVRALASARPER